jgi:hypothetical protein
VEFVVADLGVGLPGSRQRRVVFLVLAPGLDPVVQVGLLPDKGTVPVVPHLQLALEVAVGLHSHVLQGLPLVVAVLLLLHVLEKLLAVLEASQLVLPPLEPLLFSFEFAA